MMISQGSSQGVVLSPPASVLIRAVGSLLAISGVELLVGVWSHSLAVWTDCCHLFFDGLGLSLVWGLQLMPPSRFDRSVQASVTLLNGLLLVIIPLGIAYQALLRWQSPPTEIWSLPMLVMAAAGFGVNTLNACWLHNHEHQDLSLRNACVHATVDALGSLGILLSAVAVGGLGWLWADGLVSLLVAGLMLGTAYPLIVQGVGLLRVSSETDSA